MKTQSVFTYQNAKTIKGEALGYLTAIRYLAPGDLSGIEVCPKRGACSAVCLNTAGRGRFSSVQAARLKKTVSRFSDKASHLAQASVEIADAAKKARVLGLTLAVRVNGTSDLPGDAVELARAHPDVQFYDYTKITATFKRALPPNYHLTLSYDPLTVKWHECLALMAKGVNVAVVFDGLPPMTWRGAKVIDGDEHDLRFLDQGRGVVIGLKAKGEAKKDSSGFVVKGVVNREQGACV